MATRPSKNDKGINLVDAFVTLFSFDVTEDDPVSTEDFASEMGVTPMEAFTALDALADAELVDAKGRGLNAEWWISVPDVSADNAESIAREALASAEPVVKTEPKKLTAKEQAYKERTAYNAAVAASQEEGGQHLHPMTDAAYAEAVKDEAPATPDWVVNAMVENRKAVSPVIAENGETVTIPVDFDDLSKGRRELDAAKGEKLISEDTLTVRISAPIASASIEAVVPKPLPVIDGLDQFIDAETGDMVYESRIAKAGLWLDEPESIPERPEGVSRNIWDAAHDAATQTARDWYLARAKAQEEEYKINKGAPAPF